MGQEETISEREFIARLRLIIEQYLGAVDRWEAAYQKYYRLPGFGAKISDDLEEEQRAYCERRRELEPLLPRARRLCLKYRLREPFSGLLRISLGRYAPQQRMDSAIGRNERSLVTECLMELNSACQEWGNESDEPPDHRAQESLFRRFVNFFY